MLRQNTDLLQDIKESLQQINGIASVIVFGSVARGEDKADSDVDICVVLNKKDRYKIRTISDFFLDLEKKYKRNIQVMIYGKSFKEAERQFLETVLREGMVLVGDFPNIPIQKLQLEPYAIIKYDMKNLKHSEKMKLTRFLYGKETRKLYKGKSYLSRKKGLVAELGGIRSGKSSILLPEKESWGLVKRLSELGIKTKKICAWLGKV